MNDIKSLFEIDFVYVFLGVLAALVGFKFGVILIEWFFNKFGVEIKWFREKREDHEAIKKLKETTEKHEKEIQSLQECLKAFMEETQKENEKLCDLIKCQDEKNRGYRDVSKGIREDLVKSIDALAERQLEEDKNIASLTKMFIDSQISDMRYKIINFAASVSSGQTYNLEAYSHILSIYEDYEKMLKENNMTNGLVDESVEFIKDSYKEYLKHGIGHN